MVVGMKEAGSTRLDGSLWDREVTCLALCGNRGKVPECDHENEPAMAQTAL